jgi:hypothetical protein
MAKVKEILATVPADGPPVLGGDGDAPKPPPFGAPVPAGAGDLPRVVPELARAGRGETRFKIAARTAGDSLATRYVLAAAGDRAAAEACYLAAEGLTALPPDGRLVVTQLPD